jgi:hypothetical protein
MGTKQHGPKDPWSHDAESAGEEQRTRSVRICPRAFEAEQVTISISVHAKSQNADHYWQAVKVLGAPKGKPHGGLERAAGFPAPLSRGK